ELAGCRLGRDRQRGSAPCFRPVFHWNHKLQARPYACNRAHLDVYQPSIKADGTYNIFVKIAGHPRALFRPTHQSAPEGASCFANPASCFLKPASCLVKIIAKSRRPSFVNWQRLRSCCNSALTSDGRSTKATR